MNNTAILKAGFALLFVSLGASAGTVQFITNNYDFPLTGGGGAASGTLNGVTVETFCDNFADEIYVPYTYSANVTVLGAGADLSNTRFGGVSSNAWTAISLDGGNSTLDSQDDSFFNSGSGSSAVARYDMAAYLVSLYNLSLGNSTSNDQIQEAIWSIMDPQAEGAVINPASVNDSTYLEQAAGWYSSMSAPANQGALNTFLSKFEIVSPTNMTFKNGLGSGGFQEQIVLTPEPRGGIWMLLGLLTVGFLATWRRGISFESSRNSGEQKLMCYVAY